MRLIVLDVCQARSDRLLARQQLLQKGHDCWVCCCDGRRPGRSHAVALTGGLHRSDCSIRSHLSHLDMLVSLADWSARVGVPHAESRSILLGTLLDSFQSYGATRSRSPVPQAAVSGKHDSSSVAVVWAILILSSQDDRPKIVCKTRIPSTSSVKTRIPSTSPQTQLYQVKFHFFIFYSVRSFFVSASVSDARDWNFSVKSLRSSAVFGGRLQRPSPCLIRSAPRRERGWMLSETIEKRAKNCILNSTLQFFFGS